MLRTRSLALVALALLAAGCGDNSGEEAATLDQMRVVKVAGDQSAQVPAPAPSASVAPAGVRYAVVGVDGWTDEPLVARVEAPGASASVSASISGPSFAVVPAGTLVHWRLSDGCGDLFGVTTATDDSAYVVNRWAPGTLAGACTAEAGRLVGDSIVIDATWSLNILPGPVETPFVQDPGDGSIPNYVAEGDSIDLRSAVRGARDAYGNEISAADVRALPDSLVGWAWYDRAAQGARPEAPTNSGWYAVAPSFDGYELITDTEHAPGLRVWINGQPGTNVLTFYAKVNP